MKSQCNLLYCFYSFLLRFFVIFSLVLSEPSQSPPPIDNNSSASTFNITKDSSLSTDNGHRYCLSPTGIFAFGFYPIGDQYIVGIWNDKSLRKTLVWIANRDDSLFSGPSSLAFNNKGNLVRVSDTNTTLSVVCSVQGEELATYGVIHDNGNFVLYNSKGNVVWESFNNPTDTILPGQILKPDSALVSSKSPSDHSSGQYELSVDKYGISFIQIFDNNRTTGTMIDSPQHQVNLTSNGDVQVIYKNDLVVDTFTKKGRLKHDDDDLKNSTLMYRAKLDWDGKFRVYREEIEANIEKSWEIEVFSHLDILVFYYPLFVFFFVGVLSATFCPEKDKTQPPAPGL